MDIVRAQKEILQARFGDSLGIKINIEPGKYNKLIPPLTLQMLLENAIKHNKISSSSPLAIEIRSTDKETLLVKNNIQKKNLGQTTQLGIKNILKRYEFLTDSKVNVVDDGDFYSVELPLLDKKEK